MKLTILAIVFLMGIQTSMAQETKTTETRKVEELSGFEWLKQFEGEWDTDFDGTMVSRIVAKRWLVSEISFKQGVFSVQTLGYDKKKKMFVGTWVDGTSNYIWHYTGSLDKSGKALVMKAEGPDMKDASKMRKYQDIYEFKSKDEISVTTKMLNDEKEWAVFNKGKMTRKKKK